jgi:hypothetical protein
VDDLAGLCFDGTSTNGSPHLRVQSQSPVLSPTARGFSFETYQTPLGHVAKCDYCARMGRVIIPILSLMTAATVAVLFGTIAHNDLGIASATIRSDALSSAGFLFIVLAVGNVLSLLRRNR